LWGFFDDADTTRKYFTRSNNKCLVITFKEGKMPRSIKFKPLNDAALVRATGKKFSSSYPKRAITQQELRSAMKSWQSRQTPPAVPSIKESKINAIRFRASDIGKLRKISESPTPTAEAIVGQKMGPDEILGTLYSALTALEFTKMESEYKRQMASAINPSARIRVQSQWNQVVKAAQLAYASGGLKGLTETDLHGFSQELMRNKANFNSIVNIANKGVVGDGASGEPLTMNTLATGGWVAQTGVFSDPGQIVTTIENLCDKPIAEGVFTKSFSQSFALTVRIKVWCPTWSHPGRMCKKKFTIAGVSFDMSMQVGYSVTCCGATVWGEASAEACGTILGIEFCAGCTATITGVTGIGRSGTGSKCTYGLGINAELQCTFAGIPVFDFQDCFPYAVNGPCPPLGLCD
jgi:hypothetical protein